MSFIDDIKKSWEEGKEKGKKAGSFEYQMKKAEDKRIAKKEAKLEEKERIKKLEKEHIPYCPKCHSTSIQYLEHRKRLSLGRAIVGGAVAGAPGAVLGGLTSKKYKGKVKCLNCGHAWKI